MLFYHVHLSIRIKFRIQCNVIQQNNILSAGYFHIHNTSRFDEWSLEIRDSCVACAHTDKSFRNLIKSNRNHIAFTFSD